MDDSRKKSPMCSWLNSEGEIDGNEVTVSGSDLGEKQGVAGVL